MSLKTEIEAQIASLQAQLIVINRVPQDTFPLGTVVVFASNGNTKHWYYRKTAEESWVKIVGGEPKQLVEWILKAHDTEGYFEVYQLVTEEIPIYTSS